MKSLNNKLTLFFALIITVTGLPWAAHAIDVILPRGNSLSRAAAVYDNYISNPEWRELYGRAARKAIDQDVFEVVNEKVFSEFNSDARSLLANNYGVSFRFPKGTLAVEKAEIYGKILSDIQAGKAIGARDKTGSKLGLDLGYFRGVQAYASLKDLYQDKDVPGVDYLSRAGVQPMTAFVFDDVSKRFEIELVKSLSGMQTFQVNELKDHFNFVNSSKVRVAKVRACQDREGKELNEKCLVLSLDGNSEFSISLKDNAALADFAAAIPAEGLNISAIRLDPKTSSLTFDVENMKFEIPATAEIAVITGEDSTVPANIWLSSDKVAQMEHLDALSVGHHNVWISSPEAASAAFVFSDAKFMASLKAAEVSALAKKNQEDEKQAQVLLREVERQAALDALAKKKLDDQRAKKEAEQAKEEEARKKKIADDILKGISLGPIQMNSCDHVI
ncbi:MAG: hypothetical protein COV44_06225 [Deltaproteobacteria bacterium CG11_big_fil_rev_8_21_14_0_20_45_16]|nr:MAG: hypothetical protein COV44_06225 [Deltaproteobacteria bacterium CG11_big_fil_rev_8_21_14_0_20_45_16]